MLMYSIIYVSTNCNVKEHLAYTYNKIKQYIFYGYNV